MKKTFFTLILGGLLIGSLASCDKTKEGRFSPDRQLLQVDIDYAYYHDGMLAGTESATTERWVWDGNELQQIIHLDLWDDNGNPIVETFTYDGKRIATAEFAGMTYNYTYDGKELQSITYSGDEGNIAYTFTHEDGHIASITLTESYSDKMAKLMATLSPLRHVLDRTVSQNIEKVHRTFTEAARKAGKYTTNMTTYLKWEDDNVVEITTGEAKLCYLFDDMKNPYAGLFAVTGFVSSDNGYAMFNSNNITKANYYYQGVEVDAGEYTYTYEDDYPTTCTLVQEYETSDWEWDEDSQCWVETDPFMCREVVTYKYTYVK